MKGFIFMISFTVLGVWLTCKEPNYDYFTGKSNVNFEKDVRTFIRVLFGIMLSTIESFKEYYSFKLGDKFSISIPLHTVSPPAEASLPQFDPLRHSPS